MCQGQVGTFFECPDAHILWVDVHYQQHIPACALPSPFCQMREAQCTVLFLPAPSWKQHLLLPKNGQGDLQTPHSIPYLIPSYNLSHMTSFSHYLCTLQREELFFLNPCQKEYCPSSLTWWHQLCGILLVNYCAWYFTGFWESSSTGNCSKCCLYNKKHAGDCAVPVKGLPHLPLRISWRGASVCCQPLQNNPRGRHHKHLFFSWLVLRLPVLCGCKRADDNMCIAIPTCDQDRRIFPKRYFRVQMEKVKLRVRHMGTHTVPEIAG